QQADREAQQRNRQIQEKLDQPIDVDPKELATLDQLLKHIKQSTTDAKFSGIPIYVSPLGLQEAGKSLNSDIFLGEGQRGRPLREVLFWALYPIKLSYLVKDGFLMIDSRSGITEIRVQEMER